MEIAAAILHPFFLQIARHDRDLIGTGAHRGLEINPVGLARYPVLIPRSDIFQLGHALGFVQAMFVARAVVGQFDVCGVANERGVTIVQESSVVK